MNFEFFIAKRIIDSKAYKSSISAPIIKIGIVAIALGIIVMMIAIATGIGLQQKIREKVIAFNGHTIIQNYDNNNSQESVRPISTDQSFYPEFTSVPEVTHIQGTATKSGIIRLENDFEYVVVKGVGADYDWQYFNNFLVEGRLPDYTQKLNQDVLLSQYLANRLQLKLNDRINTYFLREDTTKPPRVVTFNIVGIYDSGLQEFDQLYVIGDIKHIKRLNNWEDNQVGRFEVFIDNYNNLETIGKAIYQEVPSNLNAKTVDKEYPFIFEWIKIFDNNIYAIIGIMILVAGINMITALLVLILERTQMIGILKALGSANLSIRKIFLYNAAYLILKGLFWGNLIGISILLLQKYFGLIPLDPKTYHVSAVPVYINIGYIIALNIGTFILCLLMLLVPSYIISKISPIKAIRFD
ncbi:ABC transporter permease [Olleya aquimaris]|uniref:Lipoprotein-releasing system permease protein n=1 Tax=Olleya aquimaris TaxID=639310 RepID=A0A327RB47_9FLAO|nr:FtsX-like permease family protein [Olleya aquimaris]RAJ13388.1 lipoprotein-releasing system permease protein [Olleya aquimaris]